jgi:hypothetical protein
MAGLRMARRLPRTIMRPAMAVLSPPSGPSKKKS